MCAGLVALRVRCITINAYRAKSRKPFDRLRAFTSGPTENGLPSAKAESCEAGVEWLPGHDSHVHWRFQRAQSYF